LIPRSGLLISWAIRAAISSGGGELFGLSENFLRVLVSGDARMTLMIIFRRLSRNMGFQE
jgi:hypothetical protein